MTDDQHTVTLRLIDGTTEDRHMTTAELLDVNAKWLATDEPEDEPEAA